MRRRLVNVAEKSAKRKEVQALRAVAVLLVVLYHLWPGRLPGGYVGVDVFFVISGFLITAHLVREFESSGRIALARFWARRARRLLPAAYLVLVASVMAVFIWVPQIHWTQNFREIIGSGLYFQNWLLAADAVDYLAAENSPSVVQHFWTLSVEEQFYLAWPLLILLAGALAVVTGRRRSVVAVALVLGTATAASFMYSLWLTKNNASSAYFFTPARAWEFGAGSLLALAPKRSQVRGSRTAETTSTWKTVLSWTGFAGLAWCGLTFSSTTPFPGTAALLPVFAALAIIAAGSPGGAFSPMVILGTKAVQGIGDISYSLYLWHWPPIVILPYVLGHPLGFGPRVGILVGALLAAALTKRFVEDPVRFGTRFGIHRNGVTMAFSAAAAVSVVVASLAGWNLAAQASDRAEAISKRVNSDIPACFGAAAMDRENPCHNPELDGILVPDTTAVRQDFAFYPGCWSGNVSAKINDCSFGDMSDARLPHVVLVGDSHARALLPIFKRLAEEGKLTVSAQLKGSCSWSENPQPNPDHVIATACSEWRSSLKRWLDEKSPGIDLLVTTSMSKIQAGSDRQRVDGFVQAWEPLARLGIPIVAVKDDPYHFVDPNDCLATVRTVSASSCDVSRKEAFPFFDALPAAIKATPHAHLLDLTNFYCTDTRCPSVIGGVNVYRDQHHLTGTFSKTLAPYVYDNLVENGLLETRRVAGVRRPD